MSQKIAAPALAYGCIPPAGCGALQHAAYMRIRVRQFLLPLERVSEILALGLPGLQMPGPAGTSLVQAGWSGSRTMAYRNSHTTLAAAPDVQACGWPNLWPNESVITGHRATT